MAGKGLAGLGEKRARLQLNVRIRLAIFFME